MGFLISDNFKLIIKDIKIVIISREDNLEYECEMGIKSIKAYTTDEIFKKKKIFIREQQNLSYENALIRKLIKLKEFYIKWKSLSDSTESNIIDPIDLSFKVSFLPFGSEHFKRFSNQPKFDIRIDVTSFKFKFSRIQ